MPAAARQTDNVKQVSPHCHAPIHPAAPVPTPVPHPPAPLMIVLGSPTVKIDGLPAARVSDQSAPCMLCVPAGPGMIAKGSMTVFYNNLPAARRGDLTAHPTCIGPIPGPVGKVEPPCSTTVKVGG